MPDATGDPRPRLEVDEVDAERALLGAILLHNDVIDRCRRALPVGRMRYEVDDLIYAAAIELRDEGSVADLVTVHHRLAGRPEYEAAGGRDYLIAVGNAVVVSMGVVDHVTVINAAWRARSFAEVGERIAKASKQPAAVDAIVRSARDELAAMVAEIDQDAGRDARTVTAASSLAGIPKRDRASLVPDWIPWRQVTSVGGAGGDGKTLALLQLQASACVGMPWLGLPVERCGSFAIYAEDDEDELHHRLVDIAAGLGVDIADLDGMHWRSAVADDAELVTFDRDGGMRPTDYWHWVERTVKRLGCRLVVLDSLANVFGGDEIIRRQVRAFITMLRKLAVEIDGAVVLSSHPSLAGISTGTGTSGSTAWRNSVRSALYLEREKGDDVDPDARILTRTKSNYARAGDQLRVRWSRGFFEALETPTTLDRVATTSKADRVFLALLVQTYEAANWVSSNSSARNYAPRIFSALPDREGLGKPTLEAAMFRLVKTGQVVTETYGRRTEPRQRLRAA